MTTRRIAHLLLLVGMLITPLLRPTTLPDAVTVANPRIPTETYTVNNTTDAGGDCAETPAACSLRQAINTANANAGPDLVAFDIPTDDPGYDAISGLWTITLTQSLPALLDGTMIDASTQPTTTRGIDQGPSACLPQLIAILASGATHAFEVTGADTEITGMIINSASTHGIYVHGAGASGAVIGCNQIIGSGDDGVRISDAAQNNHLAHNTISGNGDDGIEITYGAHDNLVTDNAIGTDTPGASAWANAYGVHISDGGYSNTLTNNIISGNTNAGVLIASGTYTSHHNFLIENYIGIAGDGASALANIDGVVITNAPTNTLMSNVISGNTHDAVRIGGSQSRANVAEDNTIGTNAEGDTAVPNQDGIVIRNGATDNHIAPNNLISGNSQHGVRIEGSSTTTNTVASNTIGLDAGASLAVGSQQDGVVIDGAPHNAVGPDNVISGHTQDGVRIQGGAASYNTVIGNDIGTNGDGDSRVSNSRFGVLITSEAHYNQIVDNLISGNGYEGDYSAYGGVGILGSHHSELFSNYIGVTRLGLPLPNGSHGILIAQSSQDNMIGEVLDEDWANVVAWNEEDGIHIDGNFTLYNTVGFNSIYNNDKLGISNALGGNRELPPPTILSYITDSFGRVRIIGRTCTTCTVDIYSDSGGEGRFYEARPPVDGSGRFNWQGTPFSGGAFTAVATDANGNSSEFSAAPAALTLSIDDALPHVVVNKVPGDMTAPALSTTVEFVANIVSADPTLTSVLTVGLHIPSDVLGTPTRVFYRDQISSTNGTAVTSWSNPSSGNYQLSNVNLQYNASARRWERRVVFRFDVPNNPLTVTAQAHISTGWRAVKQSNDWARLRINQSVEEIIITNRAQLYAQYDQQRATAFLQQLYSFAQGSPYNWTPVSAIYYVDTYDTSLANWDNTAVSYSSEQVANTAANTIDALVEDWVDDATTVYQTICLPGAPCLSFPIDYPPYLLIAGDDNIIPFYRRDDPTDVELSYATTGSNTIWNALTGNDYYFTENAYADLSYVVDSLPWYQGGVELATGRLIGYHASQMTDFLEQGRYGPDRTGAARAIFNSGCGGDVATAASYLVNYGYNVLNDTETPSTIDNNNWGKTHLVTLMDGNYQIFHHGNHGAPGKWTTPPCPGPMPGITPTDLDGRFVSASIASNNPIFSSTGCRSAMPEAQAQPPTLIRDNTMVNAMARLGASAVVGSASITWFDADFGDLGCNERFIRDFWSLAANPPPQQLNVGMALRCTKRGWANQQSVDKYEEKTGSQFILYGVPWVTAPYRGSAPRITSSPLPLTNHPVSAPQAVAAQTYVVTAAFDASIYTITQVGEFDVVTVEGMDLANDTGVPVVPLVQIELRLPLDAVVTGIEVAPANIADLGTLNIPQDRPGIPLADDPDPGGFAEVPNIGVYPPSDAVSRTVSMGGYQRARIYASPLTYDTATGAATLHQTLAVSVTYELSSAVGLLGLVADPSDLAPEEDSTLYATLLNPGDSSATLTGTLSTVDSAGDTINTQVIDAFDVAANTEMPLEISWTAPITEGVYSLLLELWHEGSQIIIGRDAIGISTGYLAGLMAPEELAVGRTATFQVIFENWSTVPFNGTVHLTIYDSGGAPVASLDPISISADAQNQGTAVLTWDTIGMSAGAYVAVAELMDETGTISQGVMQQQFTLEHAVFLPIVMRE